MPRDETENQDTLETLLTRCLDALEDGGTEEVEQILAANPDVASELREHLAELGETGLLEVSATERFPDRLGDFRLLERLGEGGMGVVFRAEQESLKREVAVKLIRPERLYFDGARERFQREVEVVARLSHPNVVPVYSVGGAGELPYFAMELIHGASLAEVLERLSSRRPEDLDGRALTEVLGHGVAGEAADVRPGRWVEVAIQLTRQVAAALEHAHERGVLHRDVKPSNVMISSGGRALLTDFGLASSQGGSSITKTGSMIGSLPYMPPEHLRGEPLDERSDVYSLGVTLFELLALRQAYGSKQLEELRTNILDGRHERLRDLNRAVSWDVETVCAKAMEPATEHRYATVGDFARDLDNLLALRPIEARPTGPLVRLQRWIQRGPARFAAVLLGLLLVLVAPLTWAFVQQSANREIRASLMRADAGLEVALESIDAMLGRFGDYDVGVLPILLELRLDLLTRARNLLTELVDLGFERDLDTRIAELDITTAEILEGLGRPDEALLRAERAVAHYAAASDTSADRESLGGLARARHQVGVLLGDLGRFESAVRVLETAALDYERLAGVSAGQWAQLSHLHLTRSSYLHSLGRVDLAIEAATVSVDDARQIQARQGVGPLELVNALGWLGNLLFEAGDPQAGTVFSEGSAALDQALEEDPENVVVLTESVMLYTNHANYLAGTGQVDASRQALHRALETARGLVASQPDTARHRMWLGNTLTNLATLASNEHERAEARAFIDEAVEVLAGLNAENTASQQHAVTYVRALTHAAMIHFASGEFDESAASAEVALAVARAEHAKVPEDADVAELVALSLLIRANNQRNRNDYLGAEESLRAAREYPLRLTESLRMAADLWVHCARLAADDFDLERPERQRRSEAYFDEALEAFRTAFAGGYRNIADIRGSILLAPLLERESFQQLLSDQ